MVCTFFGRRNAPSSVKEKLSEAITDLIKRGYDEFYVGNNGNFDFYVQSVLSDIIKTNCKVSFTVVLSRHDEKAIFDSFRSCNIVCRQCLCTIRSR